MLLFKILLATSKGDIRTVEEIVTENNVDLTQGDYDNRTPLHLACSEGHEQLVRFIVEYNKKLPSDWINKKDRFNNSPLDDAIRYGH